MNQSYQEKNNSKISTMSTIMHASMQIDFSVLALKNQVLLTSRISKVVTKESCTL